MILLLILLAWQQRTPQQRFDEAMRLLRENQFLNAASILEGLGTEFPERLEVQLNLGQAYSAAGQFEKALPPLRRVCEFKDFDPKACFLLGRVYFVLHRYEESLATYQRAATVSSGATLDVAMAETLEALGRGAEASLSFRAALAESSLRHAESARVQVRYGQFLARQGNWESALWQYAQAVKKQPLWGQAWLEKARALEQVERWEDAADAYEQAIAHGERNRENVTRLASIYGRLGKGEKAKALLAEL